MRYDVRAWGVWLMVTAVLITIARNPLYTLLLLLAVQLVQQRHRHPDNQTLQISLRRFALIVITLSALFNFLLVSFGQTILLQLPDQWPLIGGGKSVEALIYGASNGLTLVTLLALFIAFNQIVPVTDFIKLIPRALPDVGMVLLIALTYVPETQRHLQQVRAAQAVRGLEIQGVRQWRPLILPLLIGGLERAMALAETMVARGYGALAAERPRWWVQVGLLLGLLLVFGGWLMGWFWLGLGLVWLLGLIWWQGQTRPWTTYRPRPWRRADTWLLLASLTPALILLIVPQPELAYNPYPTFSWPPFSMIIGLTLSLTALPALLPAGQD
jgi:energy-coupling factor transport system permease protein